MPKSLSALTILLASPCPEDGDALRLAFRTFCLDWTLIEAATGLQAWDALHRENVDVVVVNADQPESIPWRDLLDEIESMNSHHPVIIASRRADESLWAETLNLGGFDLLAKPFDAEELVRVLAMASRERARVRREREERRRFHVMSGAA